MEGIAAMTDEHEESSLNSELIESVPPNISKIFDVGDTVGSVPKLIFFIQLYGSQERAYSLPLNFIQFMAIRSAFHFHPDFRIILYCDYDPSGIFWDLIKTKVKIEKIVSFPQHNGNKINSYAHMSDILRLKLLLSHGGIYLDLDTLCQKSLEIFMIDRVVMGQEIKSDGVIQGLCNAVVISPPGAPFLDRWLREYDNFSDQFWNKFSVQVPYELAQLHSDEIMVVGHKNFFWPSWEKTEIEKLFFSDEAYPDAYIFHLWNQVTADITQHFNEKTIFNYSGQYNRVCQEILIDEIDEIEKIRSKYGIPASTVLFESSITKIENVRNVFEQIYEKNLWGFGSGVGSLAENNIGYIKFLSDFLIDNEIDSVLDFGCGDWQFSQFINWNNVSYCGVDVVEKIISENTKNFGKKNIHFEKFISFDQIKPVDLIICKEVFQHLSNDNIIYYLSQFKIKSKYIIIINDTYPLANINSDISDGSWRSVRIDLPPFNEKSAIIYSWLVKYDVHLTKKSVFIVNGNI
ncbi:MAG: hypothetical protein B7X48_06140 [Acidiphilium sp. 34-60-192]|nr:MAG: hypothetical protein B7X48_06140 [Acidiphilium sp. 34-60-192]